MPHAHGPYEWTVSGKLGSNGEFNAYVIDKDGRKIAAVWGKRDEKAATAHLLSASADLLAAAKAIEARCCGEYPNHPETQQLVAAIAKAEGRS
jgi:hypothetical protein